MVDRKVKKKVPMIWSEPLLDSYLGHYSDLPWVKQMERPMVAAK